MNKMKDVYDLVSRLNSSINALTAARDKAIDDYCKLNKISYAEFERAFIDAKFEDISEVLNAMK